MHRYRGTSLTSNSAPLGPYSRDYAEGPMVALGEETVSYA
jgi:hypothetical protein